MKDRLCHSFSFMGRMRHLRPIEFSMEEAMKEIQPFSMSNVLAEKFGIDIGVMEKVNEPDPVEQY